MRHALLFEPFLKFAGAVARPVVAEQARFMDNSRLIAAYAAGASCSVTSSAFMMVHSFQAMMYREKSSRIVLSGRAGCSLRCALAKDNDA